MAAVPEPDLIDGIEYWNTQPASYNGVLGGYGTGSLPRVDALGSRQFLLYHRPELSIVPSAIRPLDAPPPASRPRTRALDVGAGVGRVTSDVLLHLVTDVVLLEPVASFIQEAYARGSPPDTRWKGIREKSKSVTFLQGTLQAFDPADPLTSAKSIGRVGYAGTDDAETGFDVIWCQWCLGHLNDPDLIAFFRRSRAALRLPHQGRSLIVVKENLCSQADGEARTVFDEEDSSLTRSDLAWKKLFEAAELRLIHETVQKGLPPGLYPVKMYALR